MINKLRQLQQWNPFQAQIYTSFYIEKPSRKDKKGPYYHPPKYNWKDRSLSYSSEAGKSEMLYLSRVYLMELGICDYEKARHEIADLGDQDAYNIMKHVCSHIFDSHDVNECDPKRRNYVIKDASEVFVGGECLSNYDYWAYNYDGYWIHIPNKRYVIKRIDYVGWSLFTTHTSSFPKQRNYEEMVRHLSIQTSIDADKIKEMFLATPPEGSRVLYIQPLAL